MNTASQTDVGRYVWRTHPAGTLAPPQNAPNCGKKMKYFSDTHPAARGKRRFSSCFLLECRSQAEIIRNNFCWHKILIFKNVRETPYSMDMGYWMKCFWGNLHRATMGWVQTISRHPAWGWQFHYIYLERKSAIEISRFESCYRRGLFQYY